jgi:hypothetical protein
MGASTMPKRCWIQTIILPVTILALAANAQAQGKGKGQGQAKAEQKQEQPKVAQKQDQGGPKAGKQSQASAVARGQQTAQERGRPQNAGQARADENHVAHAATRRGDVVKGNSSDKMLPASENASPRAAVASAPNHGREVSRFTRDLTQSEVRPVAVRFVSSNRPAEYMTGGAIAYAYARGIPENALVIVPSGNDVWIRNRKGVALVNLDDDRARNLGVWEVSPLAEPPKQGGPSFCRSGAGHPVWGRQWCLQKGFGLGTSPNLEWAAARDIGDLTFVHPITTGTLTRDALLSLLGPVAFNRLALHALTLGYTDPLTGVWRTDATGPNVLFVNSGQYPIAEVVDGNRDQRPDLMLVALRPW